MKKINNAMKHTKQRTIESIGLVNLKKGESFYTHKQDKDITAIASYYEKKVKTERLFVLNPQTGKTNRVVKVTLL
jgi:hypothetical protein